VGGGGDGGGGWGGGGGVVVTDRLAMNEPRAHLGSVGGECICVEMDEGKGVRVDES